MKRDARGRKGITKKGYGGDHKTIVMGFRERETARCTPR
jgi:hypothetical protein